MQGRPDPEDARRAASTTSHSASKNETSSNEKVREAILRYLIDYDGINKTIMPNYGFYHQVPVQDGSAGDDWQIPATSSNVENAKKLLAEGGISGRLQDHIRVLSDTPFIEVATALQSTLAQAGIKAEIISGGGSVVYDKMRDRDFEIAVGRGGGGQAPHPQSNLSSMAYNPDNRDEGKLSRFQNWRPSFADDQMNKMIEQAVIETDPEKQKQDVSGYPAPLPGSRLAGAAVLAGGDTGRRARRREGPDLPSVEDDAPARCQQVAIDKRSGTARPQGARPLHQTEFDYRHSARYSGGRL